VHRIGAPGSEIIYAIRAELDAWQASAEAENAIRESAAARNNNDVPETAVTQPATEHPAGAGRAHGSRRLVAVGIICLAVVVLAVVAWYSLLHVAPQGQPALWDIVDNRLVISDAAGGFLWDKQFDFPLTKSLYQPRDYPPRDEGLRFVVIDDIDGDGNTEVLFVSEPSRPQSQGLVCFDHRGNQRFKRTPDRVVQYGEKTYGPPWRGTYVMATGATGRPHDIWFISFALIEFPTVLEKLDPLGNLKGEYWSNGQIFEVVPAELPGGRAVVFVGACSNKFWGGSLAVLDAHQPYGSAPAASDHYRCSGCPPGSPLAFLVFPRLDVATAVGSYSSVTNVVVDSLGGITVGVRHPVGEKLPPELRTAAASEYTLDAGFRVTTAELGFQVPLVHRALEERGLLDHPFSAERDVQQLWPVLRYNGTSFEKVVGPEVSK
jgi:hypothetical protein